MRSRRTRENLGGWSPPCRGRSTPAGAAAAALGCTVERLTASHLIGSTSRVRALAPSALDSACSASTVLPLRPRFRIDREHPIPASGDEGELASPEDTGAGDGTTATWPYDAFSGRQRGTVDCEGPARVVRATSEPGTPTEAGLRQLFTEDPYSTPVEAAHRAGGDAEMGAERAALMNLRDGSEIARSRGHGVWVDADRQGDEYRDLWIVRLDDEVAAPTSRSGVLAPARGGGGGGVATVSRRCCFGAFSSASRAAARPPPAPDRADGTRAGRRPRSAG